MHCGSALGSHSCNRQQLLKITHDNDNFAPAELVHCGSDLGGSHSCLRRGAAEQLQGAEQQQADQPSRLPPLRAARSSLRNLVHFTCSFALERSATC